MAFQDRKPVHLSPSQMKIFQEYRQSCNGAPLAPDGRPSRKWTAHVRATAQARLISSGLHRFSAMKVVRFESPVVLKQADETVLAHG